ncbi:MAG: hypothetical protein C0624_04820 [Desulfuromonas sp.]|nr:MAG: hypothetical protein C0624_04820 [Desulfuromonas sp.]
MQPPLLVSPSWLQDNLSNPQLGVIENSWYPDSYLKGHIPGAVRAPCHPYLKQHLPEGERTRHVMDTEAFAALCHALGLQRSKHYVVYDDFFGLFAARFWYVLRYYGFDNLSVLDGSWKGWVEQGGACSCRLEEPLVGSDVVAKRRDALMTPQTELLRFIDDPSVQLWDTRRESEYTGEEITENLRQGHIPGALNLVWTGLLQPAEHEGEARYLKPRNELRQQLERLGLRDDTCVVTYCQSGNRAAFGNLVLELLGYPEHRLYDASMGEWGNLIDTPLVCGA